MTPNLKVLLDTVDQLRARHRAGLNECFGQLETLFDVAAEVRQEQAAIANGLMPPLARSPRALALERVEGKVLRMDIPLPAACRALMDALDAAEDRPAAAGQ